MEIKKTSLNKLHQVNQAKFVEFAGYEMPIQYSSGIIEEHKFTRSNSGIFDVSHMGQLFIYGDDNLTEDLEKIFPLDLKNLKLNSSKYSFLMNDKAGVHDDLIITKLEEGFLIILNAACKDNDFKILTSLLKDKYKMVLDDQRSLIAVQGPKSVDILNQILEKVEDLNFMSGNWFTYKDQKLYVTRSGYTGEDGFEISITNELAEVFTQELLEKGAKLIGLGARDTLRLEAGLCLYGHELGIETTPIEASLKWAISKDRLNNGGFIGSDKIINQIRDGAKKIRVGIKPEGRLIAREKTKIYNKSEEMIGEVTSGTFGPSVNGPIAMGFVDQIFSKKDTKVFLEVRGKKYPANICGLPFYKKSYVKGAN
ncbi:glycine cleavage system aminomethyltransferase GcvT [Candidatus Pelagibacter bacterium]|nr:glycine cleavage system aminomethyltransferase GcvT [Candidatus Pelagibacter bacterium]MDB9765323.1 glycine cleavage system aminomethyltransferase GcvT [Candidatus Pelagibacter sp.]MDB2363061.1 glycine cleavage system aminomethyltransferase GcvT [Candidatus Pelagibacter bacterium]MDC0544477.1 glycine cleavage system aminomethyltransferase GcvT [Candidatus Pelagibacter sp.]MDC3274184.1 glycine cleavage system aminomethyltransferase GcvT [Candidatus Pelagibacter sp.]